MPQQRERTVEKTPSKRIVCRRSQRYERSQSSVVEWIPSARPEHHGPPYRRQPRDQAERGPPHQLPLYDSSPPSGERSRSNDISGRPIDGPAKGQPTTGKAYSVSWTLTTRSRSFEMNDRFEI